MTEKVVESTPERIATLVFEDRLAGRQTFRVARGRAGAAVELSLEYTLTEWGPLGAVADAIFIRRALRDSLRRTLCRFAVEAEEEAGLRQRLDAPATQAMFVFKAAVVGAGTMGGEIAQVVASAGIPVVLKDVKQEFVDLGLEKARAGHPGPARGARGQGEDHPGATPSASSRRSSGASPAPSTTTASATSTS